MSSSSTSMKSARSRGRDRATPPSPTKKQRRNLEPKDNSEHHIRRLPRRATACTDFKAESFLDEPPLLESKKVRVASDENSAIALTCMGTDTIPPVRSLFDFAFLDEDGIAQTVEASEIKNLFIDALVAPVGSKRDQGVRCECFGRIESWEISGYGEGSPVVVVSTGSARYECATPSRGYKKLFDPFFRKAGVCVEVYKHLRGSGGDKERIFDLTFDKLVPTVTRLLDGSGNRELVLSVAEFVSKQLAKFHALPGMTSLMAENKLLDSDEKLARLLQEQENWNVAKKRGIRRPAASSGNFYIKINEAEIADDYPLPAYYKPSVQEMDEDMLFDGDIYDLDELPTRVLNNWSLYNSDLRLISLELLPMKEGIETDVTIFGSGHIMEDDGNEFCFDAEKAQSSSSMPDSMEAEGIPVYLSAIKQWVIEFGAGMNIISIRTDSAWYRLGKPSKQYAPWHAPVMRTARLTVRIMGLLTDQSRMSRLSFEDVIKQMSEFKKEDSEYISSEVAKVKRYVVAHGQIIIQQFQSHPVKSIQKCAFITGLAKQMKDMSHTALQVRKKAKFQQKAANLNPNAGVVPASHKRSMMRATMTKLISRIWGDYYTKYMPEDAKERGETPPKEEEELEEDPDENEVDGMEEENLIIEEDTTVKPYSSASSSALHFNGKEIKWEDSSTGNLDSGEALYRCAIVHGKLVTAGGQVMVAVDESEKLPPILQVEFMFEKQDGSKMAHGRVLKRGSETVLGNAASERELFLTNECIEFELRSIKDCLVVDFRHLQWGHQHRKKQANGDMLDRRNAEERKKKGLEMEFYCKSLYSSEEGAFLTLDSSCLGLGTGACNACKIRNVHGMDFEVTSSSSFAYKNEVYNAGDYIYVRAQYSDEEKEEHVRFKSGRNVGLKTYMVCHMLELEIPRGCKKSTLGSTGARVRRFYRPEDISSEKAYCSDIREVYYSEDIITVPVEAIVGKCEVRRKKDVPDWDFPVIVDHIFFCECSYDPNSGAINQLPARIITQFRKEADAVLGTNKSKGKCTAEERIVSDERKDDRLTSFDIFAGCGGLSTGLQQSGVSFTKWAVEYEPPTGEAFSSNHPEAMLFVDNCNVILRAIMQKCGDADDCISTPEADELAALLDEKKLSNLPIPGQVDFINGGPPCQGFSGMNRFNKGAWSKVQCEMILAFLSFADYFRPRYFLLENVRNFVSHNKGQTFRLTLASLLEMGYQVRFGILEAGAFGVSQSRKRAFIWAASPDDVLPEWPEPMHVFAGPGLKISLPGVYYAAVRSTAEGAPFRSITVKDTIGDLNPVENGASKLTIDYQNVPISWFQKRTRGGSMSLNDHITKEMNELNLIRCRRIPKCPGADWRCLPDEKVKLSDGKLVDLIPWCLPNTANRHNQWKGLFGRLHWEGNFPTSITDPQPMGKVGMCFHPEQDRILTVRECARSQGFKDSYMFSGNIQDKYRQIGNAVPPPLAYSLGRKLKEAVDAKRAEA